MWESNDQISDMFQIYKLIGMRPILDVKNLILAV